MPAMIALRRSTPSCVSRCSLSVHCRKLLTACLRVLLREKSWLLCHSYLRCDTTVLSTIRQSGNSLNHSFTGFIHSFTHLFTIVEKRSLYNGNNVQGHRRFTRSRGRRVTDHSFIHLLIHSFIHCIRSFISTCRRVSSSFCRGSRSGFTVTRRQHLLSRDDLIT